MHKVQNIYFGSPTITLIHIACLELRTSHIYFDLPCIYHKENVQCHKKNAEWWILWFVGMEQLDSGHNLWLELNGYGKKYLWQGEIDLAKERWGKGWLHCHLHHSLVQWHFSSVYFPLVLHPQHWSPTGEGQMACDFAIHLHNRIISHSFSFPSSVENIKNHHIVKRTA